jgi:hypothetical protein
VHGGIVLQRVERLAVVVQCEPVGDDAVGLGPAVRSAAMAAPKEVISANEPLMVISRRNTSNGWNVTMSSARVTPYTRTVPPLRVSGTQMSPIAVEPVASTTTS